MNYVIRKDLFKTTIQDGYSNILGHIHHKKNIHTAMGMHGNTLIEITHDQGSDIAYKYQDKKGVEVSLKGEIKTDADSQKYVELSYEGETYSIKAESKHKFIISSKGKPIGTMSNGLSKNTNIDIFGNVDVQVATLIYVGTTILAHEH